LSVVPGSTYSITIGVAGGIGTTVVIDPGGATVVCAGGGGADGTAGTRFISCPEQILPASNRVDIDGQFGQPPQFGFLQSASCAPGCVVVGGTVAVNGNGGAPVMFGAGGGGTAGQNGSNGLVLISW